MNYLLGALVVVCVAALVVVVCWLLRDRTEDRALAAALVDAHRQDRREFIQALLADKGGGPAAFAAMTRADQEAELTRMHADLTAGLHPTHDDLLDPETRERMIPVGFDG